MRICIDPGHGMSARTIGRYDPGAVNGSVQEADVVLQWSEHIADALEDMGQEVWWTRRSRTDPARTTMRATRATNAGCQAFLSIHCNSFTRPEATGVEALYRSPHSETSARRVSAALAGAIGLVDRGPKYRPELAVLKFAGRVSVLVELGFLSNPNDLAIITDPGVMVVGASAIAAAFMQSMPRAA